MKTNWWPTTGLMSVVVAIAVPVVVVVVIVIVFVIVIVAVVVVDVVGFGYGSGVGLDVEADRHMVVVLCPPRSNSHVAKARTLHAPLCDAGFCYELVL